ncbi:MAG: DMT family transporter [Burkholderiales bacterium]
MRFAAYLILAATLVLWSGNWIVARWVRDDIAPGVATVGRLLIALAVLTPLVWRDLLPRLRAFTARDWRIFALLGFCGGGVHLSMQWLGLHYTTATSGTLFLSTTPIFILLLASPLLGERIVPRQWAGVLVSFLGVAAIASGGDPRALATLRFNIGDLLAVASMAMWALYTVVLRLRRDSLDTAQSIFMVCAIGLACMLPWLAWDLAHGASASLSPAGMLAVVYSALGSLLLAYAGWAYVVRRLGAARAGATMHLMPAIGIVLAAIFLGERPAWFHFAGMLLIIAGVTLSTWRIRASTGASSR